MILTETELIHSALYGKVKGKRSVNEWLFRIIRCVMFCLEQRRLISFIVSAGNLAKFSFCPISALCSKFYPRNITHMPVVKIKFLRILRSFPDGRLPELEQKPGFSRLPAGKVYRPWTGQTGKQ